MFLSVFLLIHIIQSILKMRIPAAPGEGKPDLASIAHPQKGNGIKDPGFFLGLFSFELVITMFLMLLLD